MKHKPESPAVSTANSAATPEADLNFLQKPEEALVPEASAENALASPAAPTPPAELDAHGFNPADYKWVPVRRKPRSDGWTPQRQLDFIAALADTGCVEQAAQEVGMTVQSCYRLRRSPGAENFAAA